jgi:XRN 5'-3' exonuclease N-terminus
MTRIACDILLKFTLHAVTAVALQVMDYIRMARDTEQDWRPDLRHCLYGLDADLIMLSLVTHEPHFHLLREKVRGPMPLVVSA